MSTPWSIRCIGILGFTGCNHHHGCVRLPSRCSCCRYNRSALVSSRPLRRWIVGHATIMASSAWRLSLTSLLRRSSSIIGLAEMSGCTVETLWKRFRERSTTSNDLHELSSTVESNSLFASTSTRNPCIFASTFDPRSKDSPGGRRCEDTCSSSSSNKGASGASDGRQLSSRYN